MFVPPSQGSGPQAAAVRGVHQRRRQQGLLPTAPGRLAGRRGHCPHPHPPRTLALQGQPTGKCHDYTVILKFCRHSSDIDSNSLQYYDVMLLFWSIVAVFSRLGLTWICLDLLHQLELFLTLPEFDLAVLGSTHIVSLLWNDSIYGCQVLSVVFFLTAS